MLLLEKNKRKEFSRILIAHKIIFCVSIILALNYVWQSEARIFSFLWFFLPNLVVQFYHYKTLKELYYTFWTFTFLQSILATFFLISAEGAAFYLAATYLVLIIVEIYYLTSPTLYPRVQWWEYDFRFKNELKVKVEADQQLHLDGRLTDLRRKSACLVLFEDLDLGTRIKVSLREEKSTQDSFFLTLSSKRETSIGRAHHYGAEFDEGDDLSFKVVQGIYREHQGERRELKSLAIEELRTRRADKQWGQ